MQSSILALVAVQFVRSSIEEGTPVPCILADAQLGLMDAWIRLLCHALPAVLMLRDKPKPLT